MGYRHFSKLMRMELSILRKKGYSLRGIAGELGVSPASVSRELKRNKMRNGVYKPDLAEQKAYQRRKYSKFDGMKIGKDPWLEDYVKKKLQDGATPEEISGRLEYEFGYPVISFKIIYKWVYSVHGYEFAKYLPSQHWKPKKRKGKKAKRALIPDRVWIEERPKIIEERKRLGDFEGDTMGKPKHSPETLVAVVDRKSRCLFARKVRALRRSMEDGFKKILPKNALSLTMDNGPENVRHKSLGIPTYFCHPYHSWEKGTIENTFQRLRRWIPKKARLSNYSDRQIADIVERMNNTPRKCLGYRTPAEVFKEQYNLTKSHSVALRGTM